MRIEGLNEEEGLRTEERPEEEESAGGSRKDGMAEWNTKRVLVGAGARALFYPTLVYNIVRNKIQAESMVGLDLMRSDVGQLKNLGVGAVITLNGPYETLVPTSLYQASGIHHLVLPTRDYLFAPSMGDICQAVDFIHEHASSGQRTYIHCKAGWGRSTTIVVLLCVIWLSIRG